MKHFVFNRKTDFLSPLLQVLSTLQQQIKLFMCFILIRICYAYLSVFVVLKYLVLCSRISSIMSPFIQHSHTYPSSNNNSMPRNHLDTEKA